MPRKTRKTRKPAATGSVVKSEFRKRYAEHGGSVGDQLAARLRKHLEVADGGIDTARLRALAEANGVWQDRYDNLNPGLARMSCGNRLRALARRGTKIVWPR
jgi:hypothetical protein